jgi:hypothetical protein
MGTLEEAFEQAEAKVEAPSNEDVKIEEPKEEVSEEKSEDNFTTVNPEELPEELKGTYKSLQADYTRKTQEAAKIRKESEQRIADLEKRLEELNKPSQPQIDETPEGRVRSVVKAELEAEKAESFRNKAIQDYESYDPRLKLNTDTYDEATDLYVGQKMDALLAEHTKEGKPVYSFDYQSQLKEVLQTWDSYLENKQKDYLQKQAKMAKEKSQQVAKQNPQGVNAQGRPKKVSLDEAIALAQQK